jgi:Tfp pilus assembly protein PilO
MRDLNSSLDIKAIIAAVLTVGVIAFVILSVVQIGTMGELGRMLEDEMLISESHRYDIRRLTQLKEQFIKNGEASEEVSARIPSQTDEAGIIQSVQDMADLSHSELISVSFDPEIAGADVIEVPIYITVNTNYYSLVQFLDSMREQERFFNLTSLKIQKDETTGILNVTVGASAYYCSPAPAASDTEGSANG